MSKNWIIYDIDGCLVEPDKERLNRFLEGDHEYYHANHHKDELKPAGLLVYKAMLDQPYTRHAFITGRDENARPYTQDLLNRVFGISRMRSVPLLMRPRPGEPNSKLGDRTLKPLLAANHGIKLEEILLVFEDRDIMVDHWRSLGVTVYHTQRGDF